VTDEHGAAELTWIFRPSATRPRRIQALTGKPIYTQLDRWAPTAKPRWSCGTVPTCAPHQPRSLRNSLHLVKRRSGCTGSPLRSGVDSARIVR